MDAAEAMIEAKRSTLHDRPRGACYIAASLEPAIVAKRDEHVLALDAPIWSECPFDAAAVGPRGDGVAGPGRDEPVAASNGRVLARIDDRTTSWDESGAALDVDQSAIPGVSQPAGHHAVPITNFRAAQHVKGRLRICNGVGIKSFTTKTHEANFAFNSEHEGRANRLPVAAESAAADETGVQVGAPRMRLYEPRRASAARIRQETASRPGRAETVLALVGKYGAVTAIPRATDVTADIAAGPAEGRRQSGRSLNGQVCCCRRGRYRRQSKHNGYAAHRGAPLALDQSLAESSTPKITATIC